MYLNQDIHLFTYKFCGERESFGRRDTEKHPMGHERCEAVDSGRRAPPKKKQGKEKRRLWSSNIPCFVFFFFESYYYRSLSHK